VGKRSAPTVGYAVAAGAQAYPPYKMGHLNGLALALRGRFLFVL